MCILKYNSLSFLIILILLINTNAEDTLKIAVLDFNNTGGVTSHEATTLSNRLRSMLVKKSNLIVLERGKMKEILEEQGFQQTGCTTTECAVEVGKLLNVQKMVSGSIGKIGQTYTIDIALIDVATAQIIRSFMRNHKGSADGLLDVMQSISDQISQIDKKEEKINKCNISITSDPEGAELYINDTTKGKTPYNSTVDFGTKLKITVKMKNYKNWDKIVTVNENVDISVKLKKDKFNRKKWGWIGASSAVLIGGITYLILNQNNSDKKEEEDIFPDNPPGRP